MEHSEILLAMENQSKKFEERFNELLKNEFRKFEERNEDQFKKFEERLDRTDRRIAAIETVPVPIFPRPHSYFSATEVHSVTDPVRTRTGHYG